MLDKTKPARMQPLVAMGALKRLINDPEQTEEVFVVIRAMAGNSLERNFARFCTTEMGRSILREERDIVDTLMDRESLRTHQSGTLARAYLSFVESEKITADGLVEASQVEDQLEDKHLRRFGERMRDQHDLWHVVTGYGRDTFGEACLLAFTYAQTKERGIGIIALVGSFKIAKEIGPGVRRAMWKAYKAGRKAAWLPQQDWETLLSQPLDEVRQQLGIETPEAYREVFDAYHLATA